MALFDAGCDLFQLKHLLFGCGWNLNLAGRNTSHPVRQTAWEMQEWNNSSECNPHPIDFMRNNKVWAHWWVHLRFGCCRQLKFVFLSLCASRMAESEAGRRQSDGGIKYPWHMRHKLMKEITIQLFVLATTEEREMFDECECAIDLIIAKWANECPDFLFKIHLLMGELEQMGEWTCKKRVWECLLLVIKSPVRDKWMPPPLWSCCLQLSDTFGHWNQLLFAWLISPSPSHWLFVAVSAVEVKFTSPV